MAVLAVVTLVLGLFVIRPLLTRAPTIDTVPIALGSEVRVDPSVVSNALSGEISSDEFDLPELDVDANFGSKLPVLSDISSGDPVDRLRTMIGDRQEETVEILRGWLEDTGENA